MFRAAHYPVGIQILCSLSYNYTIKWQICWKELLWYLRLAVIKCVFLIKWLYFTTTGTLNDFISVYDQPHGLVVGASDYWSRGPGFDSRLYHGNFLCGGRIPVVSMVWVVSRFRLKVETSSTRSQISINSDWTHESSPRWRGPHHVRESTIYTPRQSAHQLIDYLSTLIAYKGGGDIRLYANSLTYLINLQTQSLSITYLNQYLSYIGLSLTFPH